MCGHILYNLVGEEEGEKQITRNKLSIEQTTH